jgi:hypothetical protein
MNTTGSRNFNSLLPLGVPAANAINTLRANVSNLNKTMNAMVENTQKNMNTAMEASGIPGGWMTALGIFVAFVVLFLFVLTYYSAQVKQGYEYMMIKIREFLGLEHKPFELIKEPGQDVLDKSVAPQDETEAQKDAAKPLVEKVLSTGGSEVFNVSKNTFTYYDAEPLCKALGAELATYDQVKQAWEKGADWCNYGWVKGQTAVYPTQKDTWEKLQAGPEDQRTACGAPGLNGGYFDNPELRFGVNCYGPKPNQSDHDAIAMAKGAPMSPESLEVEKKVAKFRTEAASLGVMPFNSSKWSTT